MDKKNKNKNRKKENEDDSDFEIDDSDPFGLGENFYKMMNDQLRKIFSQFPGMNLGDQNFDSEALKKMYADILRKMKINPSKIKNMSPEDVQKMMTENWQKFGFKGSGPPFVFGMNLNVGPDGKPKWGSFGNVKQEKQEKNKRDPLIDIYQEGPNTLVVVAEIPGIDKNNIKLRASSNELEIIANSSEEDSQLRNYQKIVSLPAEINPDVAKARYHNGILEVRLEKLEKVRKKIKID